MASETVFYNNKRLVGIGSVGIGTANPGVTLDVTGTVRASTQFSGPGTGLTGTASSLSVGSATTATTAFQLSTTFPNNQILFGVGTGIPYSGAGFVYNNGFVGIGTTSPGVTLDVTGTVRASTQFSGPGTGLTGTASSLTVGAATNLSGGSVSATSGYFSGSVGIGTASPNGKMHIYEATGTAAGPNAGTLVLDHGNNQGSSSICFPSRTNNGSDYGYIQYDDSRGGSGETATLIIGTSNDSDDHVALMPAGNVGIGTKSPQTTLDVYGSMNALNYAQSTFTNQSGVTITQTSASGTAMSGGAGVWDVYAYSNQGFKYGAFCSARPGQTNAGHMIGLATTQVPNLAAGSYPNLNYAWYFTSGSSLEIYESGASRGFFGGFYTTSTVVSITFDGTNIIYWKDGVSQRTVARAVGAPLYFGYAPNTNGSSINSIQFDAFGSTTYAGRNIVGTTGSFSGAVVISNPDSTTNDPTASHLYCYNPTNSTGQCSIIAARIGGSSSANTYYSLDVAGSHGFSFGMSGASSRLQFRNAWNFRGTEVMSILNSGSVGIGTTDPLNFFSQATLTGMYGNSGTYSVLNVDSGGMSGGDVIHINKRYLSNFGIRMDTLGFPANYIFFACSGGAFSPGTITATNTTTMVYGSTSDYRIKSNVVPLANSIEFIDKLRPVNFTFNQNPTEVVAGFIAHEFQELIPHAVTGVKDDVDENGKMRIQNLDVSFVVPYLTAAMKDLVAKNTNLEEIVNSQAATIGSLETQLQTAQNDIDLLESRLAAIEALISTNTSADTTTSSTGTRSDALLAAAGAV